MNTQRVRRFLPFLLSNIGTLLVIFLSFFAYNTWAAPNASPPIPTFIPYQGTLADATGQPVNGNVNLIFRLYNTQTGGHGPRPPLVSPILA